MEKWFWDEANEGCSGFTSDDGIGSSGGGIGGESVGFGNFSGGKATLFIGSLPPNAKENEVKIFLKENIPNAQNIRVPMDREKNENKGIAFVELKSDADVKNIIKQVSNLRMADRTLRIKESKPKESGKSVGGNSGGFRSGFSGGGIISGRSGVGFEAVNSRCGCYGGRSSACACFGSSNISDGLANNSDDKGFGGGSSIDANILEINEILDQNIRDQQQSSFSSYQNDKIQPTQPNAVRTRVRSHGRHTSQYRPLDSSDDERALPRMKIMQEID